MGVRILTRSGRRIEGSLEMSTAYIVHHTREEILLVAGATDGEDGDDFLGLS